MSNHERQELLYDGTPEGAHRLLEFLWGYEFGQLRFDPGNKPAGGVIVVASDTFRPGDVVQRENWGDTAFNGAVKDYRICVKRARLQ